MLFRSQISDITLRAKLLSTIIDKQWSVKQLGDYIKKATDLKEKREVSEFLSKENKKTYETTMSSFFNTSVKIRGKKIEILFKDEKEFLSFFNTFNTLITNSK